MVCAAATIMPLLGGLVLASNMTFKFVPAIPTADPQVYDVSIPLVNNYANLADIFNDIDSSPGCLAAQVTVFNPDQSTCSWTGSLSCNQPYQPGQLVRVSVFSAGCSGWVIVGAHNPGFSYSFPTADPDVYGVSIPYHTTAMNLSDLFNEIPNCMEVVKYNPDQSSCAYTGPMSCDAPVGVGEAYHVSVSAPGSWVPQHY
jgi:hypothetical protein